MIYIVVVIPPKKMVPTAFVFNNLLKRNFIRISKPLNYCLYLLPTYFRTTNLKRKKLEWILLTLICKV